MRIYDEIRQALSGGLNEDALLGITGRIARVQGNGETARPIVLHTILTVLEGTWRRWFEDCPTTVKFGDTLAGRLVPAVEAVLLADERGQSEETIGALDELARTYNRCVREFPI